MVSKTYKSIKNINLKLFLSLLILGLCPTVYTTVRVFFLGQLPGEYSYSIAGQLSWVNLIYEIVNEAIILPLYFFLGKVITDKKEFSNRVKTGLMLTGAVYTVLSLLVIVFTEPLLKLMAVDFEILKPSITYIRIESVANIFIVLYQFVSVALISLGKSKYVYSLTVSQLVLCVLSDTFLVSTLPVSLNLGVNGIGITNIAVNFCLCIVGICLLSKEGIKVFEKSKCIFAWMKDFLKIGGISGLESFVRNIAYMLMICRMVNVVGEQGTYWVANNFIWGWLLLPVTQLAELIKQETAKNADAVKQNTRGYFAITTAICALWFATIPLWRPFMKTVLGFSDTEKLFSLVLILIGFYVLYAYQNIFDATFYGLGKTNYMLFESVVTNAVYYGTAFVLYLTKIWQPTLTGIALLFGIGMAFDSIVSLAAYLYLLRKRKVKP